MLLGHMLLFPAHWPSATPYFIFLQTRKCKLPSSLPPPPPPGLSLSTYLCKEHFIKLLGHFSLLSLSDVYEQPGILKDATVLETLPVFAS